MADNKRRGRFGKKSQDDANESIFDLFEPPPNQDDTTSFGKIPVIRDDEGSLDLTDSAFVESQAAAEAEAAGLAHWTEPPTGQIPASLGADEASGQVKGPSWRGEDPNWEGPDLSDVFADTDAINHDRIIELDEEEFLAAAPPPRPVRPAPVARPRPAPAPAPEPAPIERQALAVPSVFDTAPSSAPTPTATAEAVAPVPTRPRQRSVADTSPPTVHNRPPSVVPPVETPAPAPSRPVDDASSTAPARQRLEAPLPDRAEAPPEPNGHRGQTPDLPPQQRPPAAPPAPPVAAGGSRDDQLFGVQSPGPRRRGAHDFSPQPTGETSAIPDVALPDVARPEVARPEVAPPNLGRSNVDRPDLGRPTVGRGAEVSTGHVEERFGELPVDPVYREEPSVEPRLLADVPDDDYEEYEEYDDYDDDGGGRSLGQSVLVGIAIAAIVFVTLGFGPIPTMVMIGVLTFVAVMELFNAMRLAGLRPATLLGLVGAVALPAASYVRGDAGFPLVIGLAAVFGMLWYLTGADTERPVLNLGLTFTGIIWIGGLAAFGALMVRAEDGVGLLLATIIMTAASDTLAYLGGRAYGTKAFHSASPNKTWEGTITGFFGAIFAGLVIGVTDLIDVFDGPFLSVLVLAAVVGVLAPIGDLAESLVKRDLGVKDMGTLLPGHGGILDRVDGLLFALPGAYYVAIVYGLI